MSISSELVVADASEAEAVLASDLPSRTWEGFGYKGLDHIKLITLWALVESGAPRDRFEERLSSLKVHSKGEQGPWADVLPSRMLPALASASSGESAEFDALASAWGNTQEFEGWQEDEVTELLRLVVELAESAQLQGKTMILWRSF